MRFSVAITCSLIVAACLLLGACPRHYAAGQQQRQFGSASHPWELQDWRLPVSQRNGQQDMAPEVELPPDAGPQLSTKDQLETGQLPGIWLQICSSATERVNLVVPDDMDELEFFEGGKAEFRSITDNVMKQYPGTWEKTKPGRLHLNFPGASDTEYFAQLFRGEFLFIWDQQRMVSDWYARVPLLPTDRIMNNRFDTNLGRLTLTNVVGASFEGTVESQDISMRVAGFYQSGIITMRWEDVAHKGEGYAAFHVDKEWNSLYGAAWLDDYNGKPFEGAWDGQRAPDTPAVPAPAQ